MDVMEKLKYLVLKTTKTCPKITDYLCRRWNINTFSYWNQKYGSDKADKHWSSQVRLKFYDLVAIALPNPMQVLDKLYKAARKAVIITTPLEGLVA